MMRLRYQGQQLCVSKDSALFSGRLLRTGVFSLFLHFLLVLFLILSLNPVHKKDGLVIYRVTLQTFTPQDDSSPSATRLPIPAKTQIQKEKNEWKQEIKQREPVFEKKNLDLEIHSIAQTVTPKNPSEEPKKPAQRQEQEEAPIPLPIGELPSSNTDLSLKIENNLPILLSLSGPGEQYQDIVTGIGSGEGSSQGGYGRGGSGDETGPGQGGSGWGGRGDGTARGQEGFGWSGSGKEAGIGQGGSGRGGFEDGTGTGRGGFGGVGSGNYGVGLSHPRHAGNPKPTYPLEAREKGYKGEVLLRAEVLSNGHVGQIEVKRSSGYEILDQSALSTVKKWKFIPARKGGVAIPVWVNIPIKFELL